MQRQSIGEYQLYLSPSAIAGTAAFVVSAYGLQVPLIEADTFGQSMLLVLDDPDMKVSVCIHIAQTNCFCDRSPQQITFE